MEAERTLAINRCDTAQEAVLQDRVGPDLRTSARSFPRPDNRPSPSEPTCYGAHHADRQHHSTCRLRNGSDIRSRDTLNPKACVRPREIYAGMERCNNVLLVE